MKINEPTNTPIEPTITNFEPTSLLIRMPCASELEWATGAAGGSRSKLMSVGIRLSSY